MLRSLFSGISGLRSHQTMMDVTGNNIANVNTNGFKASQTQFQDTLSQMLQGASAPDVRGGTNPAQVGLGVRLAGISTNFGQGGAQTTGRATDLMISGDGFFVVQSGAEQMYTRAGSLSPDANGNLVNPEGAFVLGWAAAADGTVDTAGALAPVSLQPPAGKSLKAFSIGADGVITGVLGDLTDPDVPVVKQALGQIALATFPNAGGLEKAGGSLYRSTVNSGAVAVDVPGANGRGTIAGSMLEMSNVDLAQEFTNLIIAQRGFQANSRVITSSDEILQDLVNLKR
jgi:flagellar hook protein FlgE